MRLTDKPSSARSGATSSSAAERKPVSSPAHLAPLRKAKPTAVAATKQSQADRKAAQALASSNRALKTVDKMLAYDPDGDPALDKIGRFVGLKAEPRYRDWAGKKMIAATAWPLSQLLAGALDNAMLGGDAQRATKVVDELQKYKRDGAYAPKIDGEGPRYYDDNAWIGLDLVQAFRQTGEKSYLDQAKELVPFLEGGIQKSGGILWREGDEKPTQNTCANAPAMQLFLALHKETGDPRFLDDAKRLDGMLNGVLRRPDGLYSDHVQASDTSKRDERLYSYNQGAAIGANLQMSQAVKDPAERQRYLELARGTADALLTKMGKEPDWLWKQAPAYNAVLMRNLAKLDQVAPDPRIVNTLNAYLTRADTEARRPENGAYELGGIGRYDTSATGLNLIDQSAMAQMLALRGMTPDQIRQLG